MMNRFILIAFSILLFMFSSCEEIVLEDDISKKEVILVAPQDNAQFNSTSVTFTWEPVQYAKKYRLQIAEPNFTSPAQIVLDTEISTTTHTMQLPVGIYEWRVQAISGSSVTPYKKRILTVLSNENFGDNTVVLSSPINNFNTNTTTQSLSWQAIIGATNYQVQILNSTSVIISDQNIINTSLNYTFPEGSFTWKVRASNGSESTPYTSHSILVDTTIPNTPTLLSPVNASSTSNTDVSFQWSKIAISGSSEYDKVYIYRDNTLTNLHSETQSTSPYNITLTSGTYYWFVKGFDAAGNESARSNVFSITIN